MRKLLSILLAVLCVAPLLGNTLLNRYLYIECVDSPAVRLPLAEVDSLLQNNIEMSVWQKGEATHTFLKNNIQWVYFRDLHTFHVQVESSDSTLGAVTGTGDYIETDTVVLTATPYNNTSQHVYFCGWNDGDKTNPRVFPATQDAVYEALFCTDSLQAFILVEDSLKGKVNGSGIYATDTTLVLTVVPKTHFLFSHWSDGVTDNPRTLDLISDTTLVAYFDYVPHAVDLGLPSRTIWANCNLGAQQPHELGDYYAWGETTTKEMYNIEHYAFAQVTEEGTIFTHYNRKDNRFTLADEHDAAQQYWGEGWHIPSDADMTELRLLCTWEFAEQEGVYGYFVHGPNGNTIFLPAAGCYQDDVLILANMVGYYWSNAVDANDIRQASLLFLEVNTQREGTGEGFGVGPFDRAFGRSIRPVLIVPNL